MTRYHAVYPNGQQCTLYTREEALDALDAGARVDPSPIITLRDAATMSAVICATIAALFALGRILPSLSDRALTMLALAALVCSPFVGLAMQRRTR